MELRRRRLKVGLGGESGGEAPGEGPSPLLSWKTLGLAVRRREPQERVECGFVLLEPQEQAGEREVELLRAGAHPTTAY